MWTSIIAMLAPVAIWIFGKYVESDKASDEVKATYKKFIAAYQAKASTPAKIKDEYDAQIKDVIVEPAPTPEPLEMKRPDEI